MTDAARRGDRLRHQLDQGADRQPPRRRHARRRAPRRRRSSGSARASTGPGRLADEALERTFAAIDELRADRSAPTTCRPSASASARPRPPATRATPRSSPRAYAVASASSRRCCPVTRRPRSSSPAPSPPRRPVPPEPVLVVDIGGGSTELVLGEGDDRQAVSMDIGSVRLHERHLHSDPPTAAELAACVADIDQHLDASGIPLDRARTRDRHLGHDQDARLRRPGPGCATTARPSTAPCCPTPRPPPSSATSSR